MLRPLYETPKGLPPGMSLMVVVLISARAGTHVGKPGDLPPLPTASPRWGEREKGKVFESWSFEEGEVGPASLDSELEAAGVEGDVVDGDDGDRELGLQDERRGVGDDLGDAGCAE